jgi:putative membrane protein
MMGRIVISLSVALLTLNLAAAAPVADKNAEKFLQHVIEGNLAEIQLGKLAQEKSMDDGIRAFGDMLVTDHSAGNEKAMQVASSLGVNAPAEPNKTQKATYDKLSKLSGSAFDRQFAKMMVDDHKRNIREFEKESKSSNAQVAQFAKDTLPTLREHLEAAQSLAKVKSAAR